ncbi:MAG: helix-turn-helix domain-containing protein [Candidatus Hodarchaeota archaeon]
MPKMNQNPYFEGIRDGLLEVIDSFEKGRKLTSREVRFPNPDHKMSGEEIADLREKKLNVSQHVFARLLNVSPRTVQAWEQNINTPSGPALRLLWLLEKKPDILKAMLA